MASASDHRAHAALQPADCLILLPQRLPAAVETSIGPAHYPAECTQSDAFLQPSLRARNGRANSNSFSCLRTRRPILFLCRFVPSGSVYGHRIDFSRIVQPLIENCKLLHTWHERIPLGQTDICSKRSNAVSDLTACTAVDLSAGRGKFRLSPGMPPEIVQTLPGYDLDVQKNRAEAQR